MVTIDILNLFVRTFLADAKTQKTLIDSIKNKLNLSLHEWVTERKVFNLGLYYQIDIASSLKIKSPKNAILEHQTAARIENTQKTISVRIF